MKIKNFELTVKDIISVFGKKIVAFSGCSKCYGRGYRDQLTDRDYVLEKAILKLQKAQGKVPETLEVGQYIQCSYCAKMGKEYEAELEQEEHNKEYHKDEQH